MRDAAKSYKTAGAFRAALETRLQTRARAQGTDLQRLRRQVAFDRFLARLFSRGPKATYPWVLKGGYAMELRMHSARTTKDIDLTLHDGTRLSTIAEERGEQVRAMLQEAAATRFDTISNSSSEKRERIWTGLRRVAAGIPSRHAWMDGTLRAFTSMPVLGTRCSSLWRLSPAKTGLASGEYRGRLSP